jgi:hypothetical protein
MASSDDDLDELEIRFQEAHGAWLFQQGRPRVSLEIKGQNLSLLIHQARLRGYDRAKERSSRMRKK